MTRYLYLRDVGIQKVEKYIMAAVMFAEACLDISRYLITSWLSRANEMAHPGNNPHTCNRLGDCRSFRYEHSSLESTRNNQWSIAEIHFRK